MKKAWLLECERTGRFWWHDSYPQCMRAAHRLGLKDYTVGIGEKRA